MFCAVPTSATELKKLCHTQRQPNATTKARNQFAPMAFFTSSNIAGHSVVALVVLAGLYFKDVFWLAKEARLRTVRRALHRSTFAAAPHARRT